MLSFPFILPEPPEFDVLDVSVPAPVPEAPPVFIVAVSAPVLPAPVLFSVSAPVVVVVESDVVLELPELLQLKDAKTISAINNTCLMVLSLISDRSNCSGQISGHPTGKKDG